MIQMAGILQKQEDFPLVVMPQLRHFRPPRDVAHLSLLNANCYSLQPRYLFMTISRMKPPLMQRHADGTDVQRSFPPTTTPNAEVVAEISRVITPSMSVLVPQ
jgi:hypothetical protein